MKKALVTGGAGFIGSHLVDALVVRRVDVVVLDNLSTGKRENIAHHKEGVEFIEGSVAHAHDVERAMWGCDTVFHLAAVASVPKSVEHPLETHETNVTGTLTVFETAKRLGVHKVVYASSSAVYGDLPEHPKHEESPCGPTTPYGLHKKMGEEYAKLYHELFGLSSIGLRFFNVYGPRQDASSPYSGVISLFSKLLREGKTPTIYGDGEATRDFVFVEDVVAALIASAESNIRCDVFNIGTGQETSINTLAATLNDVCGTTTKPQHADTRAGDIKQSCADISKAQKALNFDPQTSLKDGLAKTVKGL